MQIRPTVGRVILYRPPEEDRDDIRHAATVAAVLGASLVNLSIANSDGVMYSERNVTLVDTDVEPERGQAEWMDYQKGQAAKTEALEKELEDVGSVDQSGSDEQLDEPNFDDDQDIPPSRPSIEAIARLCHEAMNDYLSSIGEMVTQWDTLDEEGRGVFIASVVAYIENPSLTPEIVHDEWMASMISDGWKYGEELNEEEKTDPDMILYKDLPEIQVRLDEAFMETLAHVAYGTETVSNTE